MEIMLGRFQDQKEKWKCLSKKIVNRAAVFISSPASALRLRDNQITAVPGESLLPGYEKQHFTAQYGSLSPGRAAEISGRIIRHNRLLSLLNLYRPPHGTDTLLLHCPDSTSNPKLMLSPVGSLSDGPAQTLASVEIWPRCLCGDTETYGSLTSLHHRGAVTVTRYPQERGRRWG
uniref:Uncharacterized protein n=1 Tax=Knipowitschia caucasica TaxID=637954 RepID=A0AAV2KBT5_KNICA